jgi:hypothetical protein
MERAAFGQEKGRCHRPSQTIENITSISARVNTIPFMEVSPENTP